MCRRTGMEGIVIWFFAVVVLGLVAVVAIWFLHRFYVKANRETALVRTGLGGQRVVMDGGCPALPILHHIQKVSMRAMAFRVARDGEHSLLTGDRLRADVEMEFEYRVMPTCEGVATAAQALGQRIARAGEAVEDLVWGQIVNAMQDGAAARTLDEMHKDRAGYTGEVANAVRGYIENLGLTLISAALVRVDQGSLAHLDENNAFNSEGIRKLASLVAENRKERVRIETEAEIAVRESRLAQAQRRLDIERAEREAEIGQREHLARLEAQAEALSAEIRAEAARKSETAALEKERDISAAKIAHDEDLRRREMAAILALEENKIDHAMRLAAKRTEEAETKAAEEASRARVLLAAEAVQTDKESAVAERERKLALMRIEKEIAVDAARTRGETATLLAKASADARAVETAATAEKARMQAEAQGRAAQIAAENEQSDAIIAMRIEERRLDRMPEIMSQMMKPVEKIDSIRIHQIGGLGTGTGSRDGVDGAFGAVMDQILGMAVRLPAMKQIGEEIGLDFDAALAGRTADYANRIRSKTDKDK